MKYTIDLSKPFLTLEGETLNEEGEGKVLTLGKITAKILSNLKGAGQDPLKTMPWAFDLYAGRALQIDESDFNVLYKIVKDTDFVPDMSKFYIMKEMNDVKEAAKAALKVS